MDVIYWLIPLSIVILLIAVAIFFWAVKAGQFQDLESPAVDILFDDDLPQSLNSKPIKSTNQTKQTKQTRPNDAHHHEKTNQSKTEQAD